MKPWLALAFTILLILTSVGSSTRSTEAAIEGNRLVVLEYHPYLDAEDPFGIEAGDERMRVYYGANDFPTAVFDGVSTFAGANDSSIYENNYRPAIKQRLSIGTPITIELRGELARDSGTIEIDILSSNDLDGASLSLRAAIIDDHNYFLGSNGVDDHRFVVRDYFEVGSLNHSMVKKEHFEQGFDINSSWNINTLGIVAFVQADTGAPALGLQSKEVLQSALYWFGQGTTTVQSSRAVLIELFTATWCPPCKYGDEAVNRAAAEYQSGFTEPARLGPELDLLSIGAIGGGVISVVLAAIFYVERSGKDDRRGVKGSDKGRKGVQGRQRPKRSEEE